MIDAVICARKGTWDKNARIVGGRPVVAWACLAAIACRNIDHSVVSSDSVRVLDIARGNIGLHVRPPELALDSSRIEDAVRHYAQSSPATAFAVIQGNMPIWEVDIIDRCIHELASNPNFTAVATACEVEHRPEWMKRKGWNGAAQSYMKPSRSYRRQDFKPLYYFDGQVVVIRREVLMNTRNPKYAHGWMGRKVGMVVHDSIYGLEIHSPNDLKIADAILSKELT